jgi:hypothetical protein
MQPVHAFTSKVPGLVNVLIQAIEITLPDDRKNVFETRGIWDTGASRSVISQNVVEKLGLQPSGTAIVNTASEMGCQTSTYLVDFLLKDVKVSGVTVTVGTLMKGFECLIGMDIINLGDFAVTNFEKKTCVSFRLPSVQQIDFVQEVKSHTPHLAQRIQGRNELCSCGSGKKYKNCHGKAKSAFHK